MGLKRKQMLLCQKAFFEQKLQNRLSFLSGKRIEAPKVDKDTLVRKFQANIKAVNNRLKLIVDDEKKTEEMTKIKAERAAAPLKEPEGGKSEKPKKAPEKKKAPPKAPEGGKSQKAPESPEESKAITKNKIETPAT